MSSTVTMAWEILDRMERAVAKVRERLLRVTAVLNQAGVPYAVVSGHAVASWVTTVDEGAVRNTRDMALVQMKLLSNRDKDRTHVRDLVGVGLIDRSWLAKFPPILAERLQGILDTPDA